MPIPFPPLPFAENALEPAMSAETLRYHHGKHHKSYVEKLNKLIAGTDYDTMPLRAIVERSAKARKDRKIYTNAAQAWNHAFFWDSLAPQPESPGKMTAQGIAAAFGSHDKFAEKFKKTAMDTFGSGWVWLYQKDGKFAIVGTPDGDPCFLRYGEPVFVTDVWEHAYYIDHRNERGAFVDSVLSKLVNWRAVEGRLNALKDRQEAKADIRRQAGGKGLEPWFIA